MIEMIANDPKITAKRITEKFSLSVISIERVLSKLQSKGIIKREGSKKKGEWKIIK